MKNRSNGTNRTKTFIAALGIALGCAAIPASAEQATFNLPFPAHWGDAVLQAGEHNIEIPVPMSRTVVYVSNDGSERMAVPVTVGANAQSDENYLHLTKVDGVYYVDEYSSGADGKTFFFHKPKSQKSNQTTKEAQITTTVKINGN